MLFSGDLGLDRILSKELLGWGWELFEGTLGTWPNTLHSHLDPPALSGPSLVTRLAVFLGLAYMM